jgi:hypothetical protein
MCYTVVVRLDKSISLLPRQIESSPADSHFPHKASASEEPFSIPLVVRIWISGDSISMNGR